jgi:hypothetical protein
MQRSAIVMEPSTSASVQTCSSSAPLPARARIGTWRWWVLFAVPLVTAIVFVRRFGSAWPHSDEWFFTKAIIGLQRFDLHTLDGLRGAIGGIPVRFGDHIVAVPFLFYWPIAEWSDFDSRWLMLLTVATFAFEVLLLWRFVFERSLWAFPVALLFFCPSHYMEFLWGWQVTLSLSIAFAFAGLVVIDRTPHGAGWKVQAKHATVGLFLCALGMFSSAGALFVFPSAFLLVALKPKDGRARTAWLALLFVAMLLAGALQAMGPAHELHFGMQKVWWLLTALGDTILGSPVGRFRFGPDVHSALGLVIVACTIVVVCRATVIGALPQLALALAITLFGLLCTMSIAVSRDGLGNWHLQYTVPAIGGAYAAAWLLWRNDRSRWASAAFFTLLGVLALCVIGSWNGFRRYGPDYRGYVRAIEDYSRAYLVDPHARKPQPPYMDVTPPMLLFLSAHGHPLFAEVDAPRELVPLPDTARVFLNFEEIGQPSTLAVPRARLLRLTVALPASVDARGVVARIGGTDLVLRRISPENTPLPCCSEPGRVCYTGMIVPRVLGAGEYPMQLMLSK